MTTDPLRVKPGKFLTLDLGRGPEQCLMLGLTKTRGTRFIQDSSGDCWEVSFRPVRIRATPVQLARRTRFLRYVYEGVIVAYGGVHSLLACWHVLDCPRRYSNELCRPGYDRSLMRSAQVVVQRYKNATDVCICIRDLIETE